MKKAIVQTEIVIIQVLIKFQLKRKTNNKLDLKFIREMIN